jgi:transcriptional regulator with XRE-family HTH domain
MLQERLRELGITQSDLARATGMDASLMSLKVRGLREWKVAEAQAIYEYVVTRHPLVTFPELFFDLRDVGN